MKPDIIKIAITLEDNSLIIMNYIINDCHGFQQGSSDKDIYNETLRTQNMWSAKMVSWRRVVESDIPSDRTFRNAWKDDRGTIKHDIDKAKEITKDLLRRKRSVLLDTLDVKYIKALESNDAETQADIINDKQYLRDITNHPDITTATTVEGLQYCVTLLDDFIV